MWFTFTIIFRLLPCSLGPYRPHLSYQSLRKRWLVDESDEIKTLSFTTASRPNWIFLVSFREVGLPPASGCSGNTWAYSSWLEYDGLYMRCLAAGSRKRLVPSDRASRSLSSAAWRCNIYFYDIYAWCTAQQSDFTDVWPRTIVLLYFCFFRYFFYPMMLLERSIAT